MVEEVRHVRDAQVHDEGMPRNYKEEGEEWEDVGEGQRGGVGRESGRKRRKRVGGKGREGERAYLRDIRTRKGPLSMENWFDGVWREWRLYIPVNRRIHQRGKRGSRCQKNILEQRSSLHSLLRREKLLARSSEA